MKFLDISLEEMVVGGDEQDELEKVDDPSDLCKDKTLDDDISAYVRDIAKVPLLSPKKERELAKRVAKGDEVAKADMIKANLRLVVNVAKKYSNSGLPLIDLIQEGNLGLIRAVEKFDIKYGTKFSTYAVWWIKQGITRGIDRKAGMISIPQYILDIVRSLPKQRSKFIKEFKREPEFNELTAYMGLSEKRSSELSRYIGSGILKKVISIYGPTSPDDNYTIFDYLADKYGFSPEQKVINQRLIKDVRSLLGKLPERERGMSLC